MTPSSEALRLGLTRLAPPAAEPVSLAEAKAHLRLDTADEDALLARLVTASVAAVEEATGRALVTQALRLTLAGWPASSVCGVELPRPPLQAVSEARTVLEDGTAVTWDAGTYYADMALVPGRLVRRLGASWPATDGPVRRVEIDYMAGYGDAATDVPAVLRTAILMTVARLFEHRGEGAPGLDEAMLALLAPYRVRSL